MSVIELKDVYKKYAAALVPSLNGISMEVPAGKIFGFLGPNGAGKTTSISILCGLVRSDSGSAKVLGMDVQSQLADIKKLIGIVPQDIAIFPSLTARENLQYFGNLYGLRGAILQQKINYYLDIFGLSEHANKLVSLYSGGMKRRINLIAGLLHDPQLLILDEPTVGVDVQSRNMIIEFLKAYNREERKSILYTSHMMDEAEKLCDEIAIIDHGTMLIQGNVKDLLAQHPAAKSLEALFIELTGRNLRD